MRIFGTEIKIVEHDGPANEEVYGTWSHAKQTISLKKDITRDMRAVCMLHEIVHAVDNYMVDIRLEETQVEKIATGLYAVLKENGIDIDKLADLK